MEAIKELSLGGYSSHRSEVPSRRTSQLLLSENLKQQQYQDENRRYDNGKFLYQIAACRCNDEAERGVFAKIARKFSHVCQNNSRDWNSYGNTELGLFLHYHPFT